MGQTATDTAARLSIAQRIKELDWSSAEQSLSERGYAITVPILSHEECASLVALYNDASRFRSHIIMERYRFGIGDYKYFAHPLPELVTELRSSAYPHLAEIANHWAGALGENAERYPHEHAAFLKTCHKAGQTKPTPLMLHYEAGGYNCLHQDLYGEVSFFRCRWCCCSASKDAIGKAENLSLWNSSRARSPKRRWCRPIAGRRS